MFNTLSDQLRRRRDAALRLPALDTGDHDPLLDRKTNPPMNPPTALHIASIGGVLTLEQYRECWATYPDHRPMLAAYGHAMFGSMEVAA